MGSNDGAGDDGTLMAGTSSRRRRLPPRWFIRVAWAVHRAITRLTGGRRGLWLVRPGRWGTMRLTTVGRKTGKTRSAIVAYYEDGPNLVTMAMNGWGAPEPAWWLNLQAQPNAEVELKTGTRRFVRGPLSARSATASGRGSASSAMTRTTTRIGDRARPTWWCSNRARVARLNDRSAGQTDVAGLGAGRPRRRARILAHGLDAGSR